MQEMNVPLWVTVAAVAVYFTKQWCWPARATRTHDAMRHDWLVGMLAQHAWARRRSARMVDQ